MNVTTTPAGAINPRSIGLRSTGSHWGAAGEQIDTMSANLNFTVPLVTAMGRGGSSVPFFLNYNSQLWRKDSGGAWKLGYDVGYGFGWRLMAGSITPYWSGDDTIHHYVFVDATGAEYLLDVNAGSTRWSSEGIDLRYSAVNNTVAFPDGTIWTMGATSADTEEDAGTRYVTEMHDSNGNQIFIRCLPAVGLPGWDSSARIDQIEDVRSDPPTAPSCSPTASSSLATASPTSPKSTSRSASPSITTSPIRPTRACKAPSPRPPISGPPTCSVRSPTRNSTSPTPSHYGTNNAGELTQVDFPYGARLRWAYRDFTFSGTRTQREVQYRYLTSQSGGAESTYAFTRDESDSGRTCHSAAWLDDPSGPQKAWFFTTTGSPGRSASGTAWRTAPPPARPPPAGSITPGGTSAAALM